MCSGRVGEANVTATPVLLVNRTNVWWSANYPPVLFSWNLTKAADCCTCVRACVCVTALGELSSLIQMQGQIPTTAPAVT